MDMRGATTCVECIWGAGGRGTPRAASGHGRGWVGALPDRTGAWGRSSSLGRRKCKMSLREDGRKDGRTEGGRGAAMGKSGDDGDSAIVSDGERPPHPSAYSRPRPRGHNALPSSLVTFISHSTKTNFKMDLECNAKL